MVLTSPNLFATHGRCVKTMVLTSPNLLATQPLTSVESPAMTLDPKSKDPRYVLDVWYVVCVRSCGTGVLTNESHFLTMMLNIFELLLVTRH